MPFVGIQRVIGDKGIEFKGQPRQIVVIDTSNLSGDVAEDRSFHAETEECGQEEIAEVQDLSCVVKNPKSFHG